MNKKFAIVTLGCRTNQYESAAYHAQLKKMGFVEAKEGEIADVCIINTCTVTSSADSRSKAKIAQTIKQHPGAKLAVTGCLIENSPEARQDVMSLGEKQNMAIQLVRNQDKESLIEQLFPNEQDYPEFKIDHFAAKTRAFVKIQDGCNSFCTYCIIPYVRGRSRSRKVSEILHEIQSLVENGYKEVVLTGINIGDFNDDGKTLADLIWQVDAIDGLQRIRVSSIDPDEVDGPLQDAIIHAKKTCPSMHIVLQSGSNYILKRMNRKYTRQMFFDTVEKLRLADSSFTFTTDIIVGFPGEKPEDFSQTLDAVEKTAFARVHMFPYSRRKRTRASLYKDEVPSGKIKERKAILLEQAEKAAFAMRFAYVGKTVSVLVESKEKECCFGNSEHFLPVYFSGKDCRTNEIYPVKIVSNTERGLEGVCL